VLRPAGWVGGRAGGARYEADLLTPVAAADVPRTLGGMPFYRGDADTAAAYNLSGWLVKFIVEGLLDGDAPQFVRFLRSPTDWSTIGVAGERELMDRWRAWMEARRASGAGGG